MFSPKNVVWLFGLLAVAFSLIMYLAASGFDGFAVTPVPSGELIGAAGCPYGGPCTTTTLCKKNCGDACREWWTSHHSSYPDYQFKGSTCSSESCSSMNIPGNPDKVVSPGSSCADNWCKANTGKTNCCCYIGLASTCDEACLKMGGNLDGYCNYLDPGCADGDTRASAGDAWCRFQKPEEEFHDCCCRVPCTSDSDCWDTSLPEYKRGYCCVNGICKGRLSSCVCNADGYCINIAGGFDPTHSHPYAYCDCEKTAFGTCVSPGHCQEG